MSRRSVTEPDRDGVRDQHRSCFRPSPFIPPGSGEEILVGTARSIPLSSLTLGVATTVGVVIVLSVIPSWLAARSHARRGAPGRQSMASRLVGSGRLGTTPSWGVRLALEPTGGPQPVPVRSGLGAAVIATAVVAGVITFAGGLEHLRATPRLVGFTWDFIAGGDGSRCAGACGIPPPRIPTLNDRRRERSFRAAFLSGRVSSSRGR